MAKVIIIKDEELHELVWVQLQVNLVITLAMKQTVIRKVDEIEN